MTVRKPAGKSTAKPKSKTKVAGPDAIAAKPAKAAIPLVVDAKPAVKKAVPLPKKSGAATVTTAVAGAAKPGEPPQSGDAYALDQQVGFGLRKAHQRATMIFAEVMQAYDVTPMQFAALAKLDEMGPLSQNQLGRLTAMDPATILGVVGRLNRANWLCVRPSPADARLMLIDLTLHARERIADMKRKALDVSRRTLAPLSSEEAAVFNALLMRLG